MSQRLAKLPRSAWWVGGGVVLLLLAVAVLRSHNRPQSDPARVAAPAATARLATPQGVAALGRLEPAGDVRTLAAPSSGMGASPRLETLLVQEGDWVRKGQVLASFDNRPGLLAERQLLVARSNSLTTQLKLLEAQTARYRGLARSAINPASDLDVRELQLSELRGRLIEARSQLNKLATELNLSELRSPVDGVILKVLTEPGERPDSRGILEVGASQRMEAVAEVYESDIGRIRLNQRVTLESESGGFKGSLSGRVIRISPQVRQRAVLSTDPSADADARIVEVRLAIDPDQGQRLRNLAGLKVIVRFQP